MRLLCEFVNCIQITRYATNIALWIQILITYKYMYSYKHMGPSHTEVSSTNPFVFIILIGCSKTMVWLTFVWFFVNKCLFLFNTPDFRNNKLNIQENTVGLTKKCNFILFFSVCLRIVNVEVKTNGCSQRSAMTVNSEREMEIRTSKKWLCRNYCERVVEWYRKLWRQTGLVHQLTTVLYRNVSVKEGCCKHSYLISCSSCEVLQRWMTSRHEREDKQRQVYAKDLSTVTLPSGCRTSEYLVH